MSSHFDCLGLVADDGGREAFGALLDKLIDGAVEDAPAADGYRHTRWTDASGASVVFHVRGAAIECVTPFFAPRSGPARWSVRTSAPAIDPSCDDCGGADCDLLDAGGELVTRTAVQWLHFRPYRQWLASARRFDLEVVAFAHAAAFFDTTERFERGQRDFWGSPDEPEPQTPDGRPLRLAEDAFLPEGLFGTGTDMTQRATALFAGRVTSSERLTNTVTGRAFGWARIDALPGPLDLVFDPAAIQGEAAPGKIALVRGWLVGRPTVPPPPPPPPSSTSWWRRLWS